MTEGELEYRLEWAGFLIALGLAIEVAVSLLVHPLAFVAFIVIACPLVVAGIVLFLWSIVTG